MRILSCDKVRKKFYPEVGNHLQVLSIPCYLRKRRFLVAIVFTFTALLGAVSSVLAVLLGPSIQLLMSPPENALIPLSELFGPRLAFVIAPFLNAPVLSLNQFRVFLPYALLAVSSVKLFLTVSQWFIWELLSEGFSRDLRSILLTKFTSYRPHLAKKDSPDGVGSLIASGIATETRMLREYMVHFWGGLPREGVQLIFLIGTLLALSPLLSAYFLGLGFPVIFLVQRFGKKLKKRSQEALRDFGSLTEWLQQRLLGMETIKQLSSERFEEQAMVALNQKLLERFLRALRVKLRTAPLVEAASGLIIAYLLYLSLFSVYSGQTESSVQISFFATLALLSQSASKISRYFNSNREGLAASERLGQLLGLLEEGQVKTEKSLQPPESCFGIRVSNLKVNYFSQRDKHILDIPHFIFEPGKVYAILGPSGSGKTSFLKVLAGLNPGDCQGKILWNGRAEPVEMAYVPQQLELAPFGLLENISYPLSVKSEMKNRLQEVLRLAGLEDVGGRQATMDQKDGLNLSGGQIQRVFLARAEFHAPPIILIDEGTSALDPLSEKLIYARVKVWAGKGRLVILVAHRPAALSVADEVLYLKEGELVFSGGVGIFKASPFAENFS